jgi:hypothetical protein
MPLLRYQRYKTGSLPIITTYAQELDDFRIGGYIEFDFGSISPASWSVGNWVFLTYATADSSVTQQNLNDYATVAAPPGFTAGAPFLDVPGKRILITLT